MKLWIRPVYKTFEGGGEQLLSFALCTTNGDLLADEQIKEHFDKDTTGKEIDAAAKEFFRATETEWGKAIDVTDRNADATRPVTSSAG